MMQKLSGAKGVGSFSTGISYGTLPHPSSIAHEGLIDDYYFETIDEKSKLFKSSYAFAVSKDPFSGKLEHYVCVNCVSCLDGDGLKQVGRPNLNLTILLDISGSMSSTFSGNQETKPKLEVAKEAILSILSKLKPTDSFCLLTFDDKVDVLQPLVLWDAKTSGPLKEKIAKLTTRGGTEMGVGMTACESVYDSLSKEQKSNENRIIILTDAELSTTDEDVVIRITKQCASKKIYTTFVGIGIDFNTRLISQLSSIHGQNYLSVKSAKEFKKEMDDEFDYLVTPIVFNANVIIRDDSNWQPVRVYGSPGSEIPSKGKLFSVISSFPSPKENATVTKGGAIVVLLEPKSSSDSNQSLTLKVTYEDREGKTYNDEEILQIPQVKPNEEYYSNISARKAILLVRYVNFMKFFLGDCLNFSNNLRSGKESSKEKQVMKPSKDLNQTGIPIPSPSDDQKQGSVSRPLFDPSYLDLMKKFLEYMKNEMLVINDKQLDRELKSLVQIVEKVEADSNQKSN
jgi:Ca-activated chloride channel family protein